MEHGLTVSAVTPGVQGRGAGLVEAIELENHPFYVGLQAHPEFKSRPMRPSPPFKSLVQAALESQKRGADRAKPQTLENV